LNEVRAVRRPRRTKPHRPNELFAAAAAEFAAKGFAATRIADVAQRVGLRSRGSVYRHFDSKEAMFQAVVVKTMAPHVEALRARSIAPTSSLAVLLRGVVRPMAEIAVNSALGGVLKMVIAEAHNFPELSRIWYRELLGPILEVITAAIIRAQAEGEVRQGDPHAFALQAIAPLITLLIWRETFVPAGAPEHDVEAVLAQGVGAFLGGVLISQPAAAPAGWEPCGLAGD